MVGGDTPSSTHSTDLVPPQQCCVHGPTTGILGPAADVSLSPSCPPLISASPSPLLRAFLTSVSPHKPGCTAGCAFVRTCLPTSSIIFSPTFSFLLFKPQRSLVAPSPPIEPRCSSGLSPPAPAGDLSKQGRVNQCSCMLMTAARLTLLAE